MTVRSRLDAELVRRGLARSREQAAELIAAGRVAVAGQTAAKPATQVSRDAPVTVSSGDDGPDTSRAAATSWPGRSPPSTGLTVAGRRCLDAGASTGGFTDVLLRAGAAHVVAADVGYGQLAWRLRTDPRVTVLDRVNVRALEPAAGGAAAGGRRRGPVVHLADPGAARAGRRARRRTPTSRCMVKPQFEVGKGRVGAGGVVRDPDGPGRRGARRV